MTIDAMKTFQTWKGVWPYFIPSTYFLSYPQTLHWRKAVGGQDMKLEVKLGCALPQLPVGAPPSWVAARRKGGKGRGGGRGCRQQGNIWLHLHLQQPVRRQRWYNESLSMTGLKKICQRKDRKDGTKPILSFASSWTHEGKNSFHLVVFHFQSKGDENQEEY